MLASKTLIPLLIVVAVIAVALFGLWLASRAPAPDTSADVEPVPSNALRELVEAAVDIAKMVAISSGQDVIPSSITESDGRRTHAGYVDAATIGKNGSDRLSGAEYRSSVDLGFKHLAGQDDDLAVLAYSGRVQHDNVKTDAIILEAYERGYPVTFRFAQPYKIDETKQTGTLDGRIYRLPDGPPHFSQTAASRQG